MNASRILSIQNRQRVRSIDTAYLRQLTQTLLDEQLGVPAHELGLHLVDAPEMARVNQTYLQHEGSTDVITFDHADHPPTSPVIAGQHPLHGEIFISVPDALAQAKAFNTTWTSELLRYVIHGILHLLGHDDLQPSARREMKRAENQLLRVMEKKHSLSRLERGRADRGRGDVPTRPRTSRTRPKPKPGAGARRPAPKRAR